MERVARRNLSNPGWAGLSLDQARARVAANDRKNAVLVEKTGGAAADLTFVVTDDLS